MAIGDLFRPKHKHSDVATRVEVKGTAVALPDTIENNLFRIGQEAVTNALKHAAPRTIGIIVEYSASRIVLKVRDDGKGFEVSDKLQSGAGHFGLVGMRERAKRIGGKLEIESSLGGGTLISTIVGRNQAAALQIQKG